MRFPSVHKFAPLALLTIAAISASAQAPEIAVETGSLNGVPYRIDMPAKWNGILIVYYHGYSETPVTFEKDKPNPIGTGLASGGFEVIQSGYSKIGWAVEEAIPETEALREYAITKNGNPKKPTSPATPWAACSP
jgi:hypothetical protein